MYSDLEAADETVSSDFLLRVPNEVARDRSILKRELLQKDQIIKKLQSTIQELAEKEMKNIIKEDTYPLDRMQAAILKICNFKISDSGMKNIKNYLDKPISVYKTRTHGMDGVEVLKDGKVIATFNDCSPVSIMHFIDDVRKDD
jgi:hypothetical protein